MVRFYDPRDGADLARVEAVLHRGGVEYIVSAGQADSGVPFEVGVAEEDFPLAEELLEREVTQK